MKKLIVIIWLLVWFANQESFAQWQVRSIPSRWGKFSFRKADSTLTFSNSSYFGFSNSSNINIVQSSRIVYMHNFVTSDVDNKAVYFADRLNTQTYLLASTYDSAKTFSVLNLEAPIVKSFIDFSCACIRPTTIYARNLNAFEYLENGKFLASLTCTEVSVINDDSSYGVMLSIDGRKNIGCNTPTMFAVNDFSFPENKREGYACGLRGWAGKTTDSGKTFVSVLNMPGFNFYKVDFVDNQNGWVYGFVTDTVINSRRVRDRHPVLLYTGNGGTNWFTIQLDTSYTIEKIKFVSPTVGYALFQHKGNLATSLMKTTNGGQSWALEWNNTSIKIVDFDMLDSANIAMIGYSATFTGGYYITKGLMLGLKPTPSDRFISATPQPNPTANRFSIAGAEKEGAMSLINASGQVVRQENFVPGSEVDISGLPKGLYLFRLQSEGSVMQGKVVRE